MLREVYEADHVLVGASGEHGMVGDLVDALPAGLDVLVARDAPATWIRQLVRHNRDFRLVQVDYSPWHEAFAPIRLASLSRTLAPSSAPIALIVTSPPGMGAAGLRQLADAVHAHHPASMLVVDATRERLVGTHLASTPSPTALGADVALLSSDLGASALKGGAIIAMRGRFDVHWMDSAPLFDQSPLVRASVGGALHVMRQRPERVERALDAAYRLRRRIELSLSVPKYMSGDPGFDPWCATLILSDHECSGFELQCRLYQLGIPSTQPTLNTLSFAARATLDELAIEHLMHGIESTLTGLEREREVPHELGSDPYRLPERLVRPTAAAQHLGDPGQQVPLGHAAGAVSAQLVAVSGRVGPLLIPGYRIEERSLRYLGEWQAAGGGVLTDGDWAGTVSVVPAGCAELYRTSL